VNCDDDNACTTDICDCHEGQYIDLSCDDNDECTDDSCNEQICCVNTPVDNDDDNACTDDGCTIDSCDYEGCKTTDVDCDDYNACIKRVSIPTS